MTTLNTFANGDTNYVAKLNNNFATIEALLNAIASNQQAQVTASQGSGAAYSALFGESVAVIGAASYLCHGSGSTLTVDSGYAWKPATPAVVQNLAPATFSFTGLGANTYYVSADTTGAPVKSTSSSAEDLFSVVWTGSAFGTITRLANIVWGAADDLAAQVSAALSATYETLDERFEAIEALLAAVSSAAADISVADAGSHFTGTDVEAVLQEIGASLALLSGSTDVDTDETFTSDTGSTADSDPGNGLFKWNNATQASATALYVDNQTADGVSMTTFFASLPPDGYIHLVQDDDATKWQMWKWSGLPTAASGYYKFTGLTLMASGGSLADNKSTSVSFKGTPPATQPFDVHAFYPGVPTASAIIVRVPLARAVTFPANFSGAYFAASANATATTVFDVQKNGSSIGSVSIASGGTTATFTTTSGAAKTFAAGDVLSIIAPATPDTTLANPGFVLAGTR